MKRRQRHSEVEEYESMKLSLGINDPAQTNNNLSEPGSLRHEYFLSSLRRQRRITDHKR